jgi:hypothetical protein
MEELVAEMGGFLRSLIESDAPVSKDRRGWDKNLILKQGAAVSVRVGSS